MPGKRGVDIPEERFDAIFHVANGITQQMWGRPPSPQQMQHLHDHDLTTPQQIHDAYGALPHPHAHNLTVNEYGAWKQAYQTFKRYE